MIRSNADISACLSDVRFTPKSRHRLSAVMSALCQKWTHALQQIGRDPPRLVAREPLCRWRHSEIIFVDATEKAAAELGCTLELATQKPW